MKAAGGEAVLLLLMLLTLLLLLLLLLSLLLLLWLLLLLLMLPIHFSLYTQAGACIAATSVAAGGKGRQMPVVTTVRQIIRVQSSL